MFKNYRKYLYYFYFFRDGENVLEFEKNSALGIDKVII